MDMEGSPPRRRRGKRGPAKGHQEKVKGTAVFLAFWLGGEDWEAVLALLAPQQTPLGVERLGVERRARLAERLEELGLEMPAPLHWPTKEERAADKRHMAQGWREAAFLCYVCLLRHGGQSVPRGCRHTDFVALARYHQPLLIPIPEEVSEEGSPRVRRRLRDPWVTAWAAYQTRVRGMKWVDVAKELEKRQRGDLSEEEADRALSHFSAEVLRKAVRRDPRIWELAEEAVRP